MNNWKILIFQQTKFKKIIMDMELEDFDDDDFTFSNSINKSSSGFAKCKLVDIRKKRILVQKQRNRSEMQDDLVQIVTNFKFLVKGTKEEITINHITGTKIGTQIVHTTGVGRGKREKAEYNALTETCLKLGIFDIEDVKSQNEEILLEKLKKAVKEIDEENHIALKCKMKMNSRNFQTVDIKTIELEG